MKICHLAFPVLAWSQDDTVTLLSQDDAPTLLSLKLKVHSTLENGVDHLMDVVGSRNVTQMASLLQNLVEDTVTEGSAGYDLDGEVQAALQMIKEALLGDIRGALKEAHCFDQQELHKQILCFQECETRRRDGGSSCGSSCDGTAHKVCRDELLNNYKDHIKHCRDLDDFVRDFAKNNCPKFEKKCCLLSHTTWNCGGLCDSKIASLDVDGSLGSWIQHQIATFERGFTEWEKLHATCTNAYKAYVEKDAACDCLQAECETRNCEYDSCHFLNCEDNYNKCWGRCEAEYDRTNEAKECLEKDRKIDWSATEKIECYVDVLLAKPDNETLLAKCGSTDCVNQFREEMYHACNDLCVEVDFDSGSKTHHKRREGDIDVTDEGVDSVYTKHRGAGEDRCTSHLDLDYQLPPCCHPCEPRPPPPCDGRGEYMTPGGGSYMWTHYGQFGHLSEEKLDLSEAICHTGEHTQMYAYNLCDCLECAKNPVVPPPTCKAAKQCTSGEYDYSQHEVVLECGTSVPLPPTNCATPDGSKTCHFWGDPHFTHLFFSNNQKGEKKKGGYHGGKLVDFWPKGVFNLASNVAQTFEAQVFYCPWHKAPTLGTGLAMRFGEDLVQWVRGPSLNGNEANATEFYVNGKKVSWEELGDSAGTRGSEVSGTGGLSSSFMYMQQFKTNHQSGQNILPVCAGDGRTLVEMSVRRGGTWYVQEATIRSNEPATSGICGATEDDMKTAQQQEAFRTDAKKIMFTSMQMKSMCEMCGLNMNDGHCEAPGHDVPPEQVCKSAGADLEEAKEHCATKFKEGSTWFSVCVMEVCVSGDGSVAIAKIEEHIQEHLIADED